MDFNCIVIGGGIVGLAATDHISANTDNVALFERNSTVGFETSSRNSEVIHAGLYYGKDSKKARMCVEGRREIYRLAQEHGIPAHKCGKIIVSTNPQESEQLQSLLEKGRENEVEGLQMLTGAQVRKREPHVSAIEGLLSPESGIVDSHALMTHYRRRAEEQGAFVVVNCTVTALEKLADGWKVTYHDSDGVDSTTAATVVNAAGLGAQDVMRMASFDPDQHDLTLHLCKGEYFTVKPSKADKVKCLVYPVPKPNLKSLGIHTVVDMSGMFKLGPSAFYVDEIDYSVDESNIRAFHQSVSPYLPYLDESDLAPDFAGIRPKLSAEGEAARDFHIRHEAQAGLDGFINLAGIDSPGLTAAPAIGRYVADMVNELVG